LLPSTILTFQLFSQRHPSAPNHVAMGIVVITKDFSVGLLSHPSTLLTPVTFVPNVVLHHAVTLLLAIPVAQSRNIKFTKNKSKIIALKASQHCFAVSRIGLIACEGSPVATGSFSQGETPVFRNASQSCQTYPVFISHYLPLTQP
jgi:hypothetical protein